MAPEKVLNCVDYFCIGELMFCQRAEFHRMNMAPPAVRWEGDCEQDFGDHRCTHMTKNMIPNSGVKAKDRGRLCYIPYSGQRHR